MYKKPHKSKVLLASDDIDFSKLNASDEQYYWFFLSRRYDNLLRLKKLAPENFHFVEIAGLLNSSAYKIRRPYLDFIGKLSLRFASLPWWTSRIAEKNVMTSPVFLYVCYLYIFDLLSNNELKGKNLCVFSESPALLETISKLALLKNYVIKRFYKNESRLIKYLKIYKRICFFLYNGLSRKKAGAISRRQSHLDTCLKNKSLVVIRTWVGENNLSETGTFKDSYFSDLASRLQIKGKTVAVIPVIFNTVRSFSDIIKCSRQSKVNFIIPEDYYLNIDYFRIVTAIFNSLSIFRDKFEFEGLDVSLLFREEISRTLFDPVATHIAMQYYLPERFKQKGLDIERFILTFENMSHEKPFLMGMQRFYPNAKTLGFQHSVLFPLLLSLYTSLDEAKVMPMPDKIICSGKFFREKLAEEGFPANKLIDGPALRFQYLLDNTARDTSTRDKKVALITLPLGFSGALELFSKAYQALKSYPQLIIWLKAHPAMSNYQLSEIFRLVEVPKDAVKIVDGPIDKILPQVGMVIATASGTIFDALAFGLPVIRVRLDVDLNLDPLDWLPEENLSFVGRTPNEITSQIDKILSMSEKGYSDLKEIGSRVIEKCFSPFNELTLEAFLN